VADLGSNGEGPVKLAGIKEDRRLIGADSEGQCMVAGRSSPLSCLLE
jgi:hypothetical protein